jgi:hypothetical protein
MICAREEQDRASISTNTTGRIDSAVGMKEALNPIVKDN